MCSWTKAKCGHATYMSRSLFVASSMKEYRGVVDSQFEGSEGSALSRDENKMLWMPRMMLIACQ